jgi:hypothetical protein
VISNTAVLLRNLSPHKYMVQRACDYIRGQTEDYNTLIGSALLINNILHLGLLEHLNRGSIWSGKLKYRIKS